MNYGSLTVFYVQFNPKISIDSEGSSIDYAMPDFYNEDGS